MYRLVHFTLSASFRRSQWLSIAGEWVYPPQGPRFTRWVTCRWDPLTGYQLPGQLCGLHSGSPGTVPAVVLPGSTGHPDRSPWRQAPPVAADRRGQVSGVATLRGRKPVAEQETP
ncbi:hypothetical protein ACFQ4Y_16455 [Kroppenstedtia sanguinis]|uniref:Uncharacterized protein n=1 Tax=Kroppenstedtia sanguinis TaxID=1380684 RepID=A0ABW4CDX1_9BACL